MTAADALAIALVALLVFAFLALRWENEDAEQAARRPRPNERRR
jgi:hypothetical protein